MSTEPNPQSQDESLPEFPTDLESTDWFRKLPLLDALLSLARFLIYGWTQCVASLLFERWLDVECDYARQKAAGIKEPVMRTRLSIRNRPISRED